MSTINGFEVESCKRYFIEIDGWKPYFTVTDKSIMFHAANEGDITNQEKYTSINAICRLSSKLRGCGLEWNEIYRQLDAASMGNMRTVSAIVGQIIRDKCCI